MAPAHVHVVGVAGVGMSALAQALLDAGYRVSGSDRHLDQGQDVDILDTLRLAGVSLHHQDGSGIHEQTVLVAVSTAIEPDNPDLVRAQQLRVPVVHRADMLARLTAGKHLVAVTGTAGKTTVTGMLGHICSEAGMDPVVVNGGIVSNWQAPNRVGSARRGNGQLMIIEADESDRSLLSFRPYACVITNVSKDHFDLPEVIALFNTFRASASGWVLLGPRAAAVLDGKEQPGIELVEHADGRWVRVEHELYPVPMPGRHNAENTALVVQAALKLGVTPEKIRRALATFRGIHRRLEVVGRADGITVIDDYAHNPAKIAASWRAVAETAARVIGIWRPHGYGPLAHLFDELVREIQEAMRPGDRLFILPVYYAGGTASKTRDAERLAETLAARGLRVEHVRDYEVLRERILMLLQKGDVVLGMGARDPGLPRFLRHLLPSR